MTKLQTGVSYSKVLISETPIIPFLINASQYMVLYTVALQLLHIFQDAWHNRGDRIGKPKWVQLKLSNALEGFISSSSPHTRTGHRSRSALQHSLFGLSWTYFWPQKLSYVGQPYSFLKVTLTALRGLGLFRSSKTFRALVMKDFFNLPYIWVQSFYQRSNILFEHRNGWFWQ